MLLVSPLFISPLLFQKIVPSPVHRLIYDFPWGSRIFVANYRGDMTSKTAGKRSHRRAFGRRSRRERQAEPKTNGMSTANCAKSATDTTIELIDFKLSLCPEFIIKLDADLSPVSTYMEHSIRREKPLYLGVGATRIDRNSIADCEEAKEELEELTTVNVKAIKTVSESLALKGYPRSNFSWPGDVYIEDINAESDLDLVETIIKTVAKHGEL